MSFDNVANRGKHICKAAKLEHGPKAQHWNSRGHFFGAVAEAMRRILVENACHKKAETTAGSSGASMPGRAPPS
jgi:hypothetical protein